MPVVAMRPLIKPCPKCEGHTFTRRYCDGRSSWCANDHRPEPAGEHLRVTCQSCGYGWNEPCADAALRAPAKEGGGR